MVRQDHLHQDKEEHRANKGLLRVTTATAKVTCPSSAQNQGRSVMPNAKIALMANLSHYGSDNLVEVNDLLTAELERYKSQERVLNELKHDEKASTSYEYS
nr:hypothetical protein [Tanacetum cinerariifolium]